MKKVIITSLIFLSLTTFWFAPTTADAVSWCPADNSIQNCCDESEKGGNGLVPCGIVTTGNNFICRGKNPAGASRYWYITATSLAQARTQCINGAPGYTDITASGPLRFLTCRCEIYHVFFLLLNVYKFAIWIIALPLAGLLFVAGGILWIVGGAMPKLHDLGKRFIWGAIWGLALIVSSYLIISIVMLAIGYSRSWFIF